MRRMIAIGLGLLLGALGLLAGLAVAGLAGPVGPPAVSDATVPSRPLDLGAGEQLILVIGGVYPTRAEAIAANATLAFGEMQGYYVVPTAQFEGLREQVDPGEWALASAFRTEQGAREFAEMAAAFGAPAQVLPVRVRSLGGTYAGLGQEAAPDGTGPLVDPVAESSG